MRRWSAPCQQKSSWQAIFQDVARKYQRDLDAFNAGCVPAQCRDSIMLAVVSCRRAVLAVRKRSLVVESGLGAHRKLLCSVLFHRPCKCCVAARRSKAPPRLLVFRCRKELGDSCGGLGDRSALARLANMCSDVCACVCVSNKMLVVQPCWILCGVYGRPSHEAHAPNRLARIARSI